MANIGEVQFNSNIFDSPEMVVESRIYPLFEKPLCGTKLDTGMFYSKAVSPAHGTILTNFSSSSYSIFRKLGSNFSSSMVGCSVRLSNVEIGSLFYSDRRGKTKEFSGTIRADFVSKIKSVTTSEQAILTKPFSISNIVLESNSLREDSTYFESIGTYYISNVQHGTFEIIHSPRVRTEDLTQYSGFESILEVEFSGLRFNKYPKMYRIFKRSSSTPESETCIGFGNVEANELFETRNVNFDYRAAGFFYSSAHASSYWLSTSGLSFWWSPTVMIDSISLNCQSLANEDESQYFIFKEISTEVGRAALYIPTAYQSGSEWYTDEKLFSNFGVEPETYYSCVTGVFPDIV